MFTPNNKKKIFVDLTAFFSIFYKHFIDLNVMPVTIEFFFAFLSINFNKNGHIPHYLVF